MTTTKAPGDGLPAQLPDEDFHAYMSRLYREQGMARGESPTCITVPPTALRPVLAIPARRAGAIPPASNTQSSNFSNQRNNC